MKSEFGFGQICDDYQFVFAITSYYNFFYSESEQKRLVFEFHIYALH